MILGICTHVSYHFKAICSISKAVRMRPIIIKAVATKIQCYPAKLHIHDVCSMLQT